MPVNPTNITPKMRQASDLMFGNLVPSTSPEAPRFFSAKALFSQIFTVLTSHFYLGACWYLYPTWAAFKTLMVHWDHNGLLQYLYSLGRISSSIYSKNPRVLIIAQAEYSSLYRPDSSSPSGTLGKMDQYKVVTEVRFEDFDVHLCLRWSDLTAINWIDITT